MFNINSKYFSFFNNKSPASWVAHITRNFLTCYSCLYYSSMVFSYACPSFRSGSNVKSGLWSRHCLKLLSVIPVMIISLKSEFWKLENSHSLLSFLSSVNKIIKTLSFRLFIEKKFVSEESHIFLREAIIIKL